MFICHTTKQYKHYENTRFFNALRFLNFGGNKNEPDKEPQQIPLTMEQACSVIQTPNTTEKKEVKVSQHNNSNVIHIM